MPVKLTVVEGATPLDPDTLAGLKPTYLSNQAELDAAEEANILRALNWAGRERGRDLLRLDYVLQLHRRMFGDVWTWAGTWRRRQTNIGVAPATIPERTQALLSDARYWLANTTYDPDELAVRLHHQMVFIHPFANGNGRHTRLLADLLVASLNRPVFSWGGRSLSAPGELRRSYIDALQRADHGDIVPLLAFARS
ncbi:MAG: mobile mystery protein B [Devosia nanyangense]|uniref:Mobile mystery protein B n=1 Tax=Devosia nanyangense TaxID=1228055 RepID=A0A933P0K6_9HYPH|nr:mobile mystery protein B [Devosia nanyangense]